MPISVSDLFSRSNVSYLESVRWGMYPKADTPGIYAVSLSSDPRKNDGLRPEAPISVAAVGTWMRRVPSFTFDDFLSPDAIAVADFLARMWLPDESILYLGSTGRLHTRLRELFMHELGDKRPHAGGHWLKTLENLPELHVHLGACSSAEGAKTTGAGLLTAFAAQVSPGTRSALFNPEMAIPFANREHPQGTRKQSRIARDVER